MQLAPRNRHLGVRRSAARAITLLSSLLSSSLVALAPAPLSAEPSSLPTGSAARPAELEAPPSEVEIPDEAPPPELPPLDVVIDRKEVDLEARQLVVRMSRAAGRVELKIYGESGALLTEQTTSFAGRPARSPLRVSWPKGDEPVAKLEVYAFDQHDYFKAIAIVPWSFSVPHEEVVFEHDSAEIRASEEPKLRASLELIQAALQKHEDLGKISLFIAGHTDTMGKPQHNLELSRRRALSIARWFRANGLSLDIAYEGFGESALLVKTADETKEPRNRRVDYVLSVEVPRFANSQRTPAWKRL